ncbi:hypothetical protein EVG20_g5433 [Dentipellis fragilis]|uniref:Nudix hydrolase domain-containing protein n=1 Tax=Dentipellis fragilis TaxID=205917 RepID=A0A4Y9YU05_9AGAM|nr:hypothetical protein EVG20_g5433 [Dentipellis fragilis]
MAAPKIPTTQFLADEFLICGGSILFDRIPPPSPAFDPATQLKVCLLRHTVRNEWLLPKGRKDRGEAVEHTAARETYEETGYPCALLPVTMATHAPQPGSQSKDHIEAVPACVEPFMMTLRTVAERNVKLIWWFVTIRTGALHTGTQTAVESYESEFVEAGEAMTRATFQSDRTVIARAVELVRSTYYEGGVSIPCITDVDS